MKHKSSDTFGRFHGTKGKRWVRKHRLAIRVANPSDHSQVWDNESETWIKN